MNMKRIGALSALFVLFAMAFAFAVESAPLVPAFEQNVYGVSVWADYSSIAKVHGDRWWATAETANALAVKYGAVPVLKIDSPQTGPNPRGWYYVQVPADMVQQADTLALKSGHVMMWEINPFAGLPLIKMWNLKFTNPDGSSCLINAGYLAGYFARNPEDQFPGLADHFVKQIIAGECGQ